MIAPSLHIPALVLELIRGNKIIKNKKIKEQGEFRLLQLEEDNICLFMRSTFFQNGCLLECGLFLYVEGI